VDKLLLKKIKHDAIFPVPYNEIFLPEPKLKEKLLMRFCFDQKSSAKIQLLLVTKNCYYGASTIWQQFANLFIIIFARVKKGCYS